MSRLGECVFCCSIFKLVTKAHCTSPFLYYHRILISTHCFTYFTNLVSVGRRNCRFDCTEVVVRMEFYPFQLFAISGPNTIKIWAANMSVTSTTLINDFTKNEQQRYQTSITFFGGSFNVSGTGNCIQF